MKTGSRLDWRGESLQVGASVGLAMYPAHGRTVERLIEVADAALYRAKRAGRDQVCAALPEPEMTLVREATP